MVLLAAVLAWSMLAGAARAKSHSLQVYFIDVDGGQSTLFVTPAGKSLLIDTGWAGNDGLDAERIAAAAKDAGVSKIDYLLLTHYHADHVGGVPELVAQIPVGTFIDHGPTAPPIRGYQQMLCGLSAGSGQRPLRPYRGQARRCFTDSRNQGRRDQLQWRASQPSTARSRAAERILQGIRDQAGGSDRQCPVPGHPVHLWEDQGFSIWAISPGIRKCS